MSWPVVVWTSGILPQAVALVFTRSDRFGHAARWSSRCELVGRAIGIGHFAASCRGVCPIRPLRSQPAGALRL